MSSAPHVKICCIASIAEAKLAMRLGARAVGLVSHMPSGPGVIDEATIAQIAAAVPPTIATFLLTSRQDADSIIAQHRACSTTTLQLVDHVPPAELRKLRAALPGIKLVQVVHVTGSESVAEAIEIAPLIDALLLDSGNQKLPVKELGGTGRAHDWRLSRQIRDAVSTPLFLAGGLNAANVADAIRAVDPFGLDLCSGVRSNGALDAAKLGDFFAAVRSTIAEDK